MRVLIVGQIAQATGFGRVTRAIARELATHLDTHVLGIDWHGDCHSQEAEAGALAGCTVHANPAAYDVFAERQLPAVVDQIRPHAVLLYSDPWFIPRFLASLQRARHRCRVAGYVPVEGPFARPSVLRDLAGLDALVLFTEFGRQVVQAGAAQHGWERDKPFRSVAVIPHGLARDDFYPLHGPAHAYGPRRLRARQQLLPARPETWHGFWVLNANRNQPRKRIDLTLEGFAQFAENKPTGVHLYLHMEPRGIGVDVRQEARRLGIASRLLLAPGQPAQPYTTSARLNLIYNCCDAGINTALAEGWGLTSCEHAATGAPQIVPDHSACAEIWQGAAELLPVEQQFYAPAMLQGGATSPKHVAAALERLYQDPQHYGCLLAAGYGRATSAAYDWTRIGAQWRRLFEELADSTVSIGFSQA